MTKFAATFSNGQTITRNSDHAYAFAWALIRKADGFIQESGFSATREGAAKAAQGKLWNGVSTRERKHPAIRSHWARLAKERGHATVADLFAAIDAEAAAFNAARRIEIIPVN